MQAAPAPALPRRHGVGNRATVALCMLAYVFSYIDRLILSLLIGPVRSDLAISDTAFGLLTGLAFALLYATLGVPIATLSDRVSRPAVIAAGVLVWSLATIGCGLADTYAELFLARVLVGAGEAALAPAVYSLLADMVPRERLGRALSGFSTGIFLGSGLAFLVGGSVIAAISHGGNWTLAGMVLRPWQVCFVLVGAPGLLVALAIALLVREPFPAGRRPQFGTVPGLRDVAAFLWRTRAIFGPHMLGFTLLAMSTFSFLGWAPAFLIRVFGLTPQATGFWLGSLSITAGTLGVLAAGWIMDRLDRAGRPDAPFLVGMAGALCTILPAAALPFVHAPAAVGALLAVIMFFSPFPVPTSTAVMQLVPPARMRSRISALFLLCNSLGGLALGSAIIGLLNDHVFRGPAGVASSMAIVIAGASGLGTLVLGRATAPYRRLLGAA